MWSQSPVRGPRFAPRLEALEDRAVPATFTVTNLADAGFGSLRQAVLDANARAGADVIDFAPGLRGTVALTSGELSLTDAVRIDAPGAHKLAVSGSDLSRVFSIAAGAVVEIDGLTVTRGNALLRGGGIRNDGTLTLTDAVVSDNRVTGLPGAVPTVAALGGGIYNSGALAVARTTFARNVAQGATGNPGGPGSAGIGGAICSFSLDGGPPASADISNSTFVDNRALGGAAGVGAGAGGGGVGGAIQNDNSSLTVSRSTFVGNRALGGAATVGTGGFGAAGAIANAARFGDTALVVTHSVFVDNRAAGGAGAVGGIGRGGAVANFVAFQAPLGAGFTATTTIEHSALTGNRAVGGAGTATGGAGQGGGITNENGGALTVTGSALLLNRAVGGTGGTTGGNGLGGGVHNGPTTAFGTTTVELERTAIALNRAEGGTGTASGSGLGGGLYVAPGSVASADPLTFILFNDATTSDDDVFGILV
jgi:fibronectin-binding autotransporter adhesin